MNTATLPPSTAIITLAEKRRAAILETTVPALCRENHRATDERNQLRSTIERALKYLHNGRSAGAIDVLERAIRDGEGA